MTSKSVGLNILWWGEAIVTLRVLLFSMPVMVNKHLAERFSLSNPDDRFIAVMSLTALLYFAVGVISVSGYRFWKALHFAAVILVLLGTAGSLNIPGQPPAVGAHYFFPFFFALAVTLLSTFLGGSKQKVE